MPTPLTVEQQKVVDEKRELDAKLEKLVIFINTSELYKQSTRVDQDLMREQRECMFTYSSILAKRIKRFNASSGE
jgi:uncharacterized Fe-S center protein